MGCPKVKKTKKAEKEKCLGVLVRVREREREKTINKLDAEPSDRGKSQLGLGANLDHIHSLVYAPCM